MFGSPNSVSGHQNPTGKIMFWVTEIMLLGHPNHVFGSPGSVFGSSKSCFPVTGICFRVTGIMFWGQNPSRESSLLSALETAKKQLLQRGISAPKGYPHDYMIPSKTIAVARAFCRGFAGSKPAVMHDPMIQDPICLYSAYTLPTETYRDETHMCQLKSAGQLRSHCPNNNPPPKSKQYSISRPGHSGPDFDIKTQIEFLFGGLPVK